MTRYAYYPSFILEITFIENNIWIYLKTKYRLDTDTEW